MKNYRQLQNGLASSLEDLKSQRTRSENIFNDLTRYLESHQGIPKECLFFALFPDGRDPLVSSGAKEFVILEEDRSWSCNLILKIYETGPQGETSHVTLRPKLTFGDGNEVLVGIDGVEIDDVTVTCPPDNPTTSVTEPLAELVTEAAAIRIARSGGADERQNGFGA